MGKELAKMWNTRNAHAKDEKHQYHHKGCKLKS